jgi:RNA polymerase sigma factor (sigma-70 family)
MLDIDEAQQLMETFIELRIRAKETNSPSDMSNFKMHERLCIEKFSYLVAMDARRYKSFANYEDLYQEGYEALVKGMKNYNPKKGNAFWWFHRYIKTRIQRSANTHTTIRYPLKVAKANIPHKEANMPVMIEEVHCPDKELENAQVMNAVMDSMDLLDGKQKAVMGLIYGITVDKPLSINKTCKKLGITRVNCVNTIESSLAVIRENIKV